MQMQNCAHADVGGLAIGKLGDFPSGLLHDATLLIIKISILV